MTGLLLFIPALACIIGLNVAASRGREQLAIALLFGMGLLLGFAVGPVVADYGLVYIAAYRRENRWVKVNLPAITLTPTRRVPAGRLGWRFWHHDYVS